MKIVNLIGGLGNQMFEYAMYLALKDAHPTEEVKVCTRGFRGYGLHNGLEIQHVFNVPLPEATLWECTKLAYPFYNYKTWQVMSHFLPHRRSMTLSTLQVPFDYSVVTSTKSMYYDGYWQNEKFFKQVRKQVLQTFTFPLFTEKNNDDLAKKLLNSNSVSIHVRHGDYLKEPLWCVCTPEYYYESIKKIRELEKIDVLCVFSDDIAWCKENLISFTDEIDVVFVDWNKGELSYRDMQLMTFCKHNIIANSTFSWWGAWLGQRQGKIVVAPKVWTKEPINNDPICEGWIRI